MSSSRLKPVLRFLPRKRDYRELPKSWPRDLLAGISVGIVALPLALAFAISSGVDAAAGLVTAVIAGFVAAVFGGSGVQVSGPTGAMVVVLAPIAASYGPQAIPLVAVMAGIVVVVAGFLRLGRTVSFIPWPVIEGFTLGIAVIIFLQQVPSALGSQAGESRNAFVAAVQSFDQVSTPDVWWSLACAAAVAVIMVLVPRLHSMIPGSIVAIIAVTLLVEPLNLPLTRIGELPESLPAPSIPLFDPSVVLSLMGPAVTVAMLAAIESLLSARVASNLSDAGAYDGDRELVGQGLASIASGFFGGMPATGAIARTAVSIRSGARTRAAAAIHALFLAAVVYLASDVVGRIPLVALSGVLMVTAVNMVDRRMARKVIAVSRTDALIFGVTALVTVSVDLIIAVGLGIAVTAFFALRALSRMATITREDLPAEPEPGDDRIALLRIEGALFFGVGDRILSYVARLDEVDVVILRMSQLGMLDSSGVRALVEVVTVLERRGITVLFKGIQPRHRRLVDRGGVVGSLRSRNHLLMRMDDAVEHARYHVRLASEANSRASIG